MLQSDGSKIISYDAERRMNVETEAAAADVQKKESESDLSELQGKMQPSEGCGDLRQMMSYGKEVQKTEVKKQKPLTNSAE